MNFSFKRVLAVVAALVVVYMAKSVFVDPRLASYGEEADTYSQAAKGIEGRVKQANNVKLKQDEYKQRLDKVAAALPEKVDLDDTLAVMRQVFESNGVVWSSFSPQPLAVAPPVTAPTTTVAAGGKSTEAKAATVTVPVTAPPADLAPKAIRASLSIRGPRANIQRSLDGLKALDRLLIVDNLNVAFEGGQVRLTVDMRMFVYKIPEPPKLTDLSDGTSATTVTTAAK